MRILPFVSITIALAALVGSAVLLHQVRRHVASALSAGDAVHVRPKPFDAVVREVRDDALVVEVPNGRLSAQVIRLRVVPAPEETNP